MNGRHFATTAISTHQELPYKSNSVSVFLYKLVPRSLSINQRDNNLAFPDIQLSFYAALLGTKRVARKVNFSLSQQDLSMMDMVAK